MPHTHTLRVFEKLRPVFDEKQAIAIAEAIELAIEEKNKAAKEGSTCHTQTAA